MLALAGGAAMMGRGKKKFGTDAGFLKSGAAGGASLSSPPIHGTDHIPKVVAPVDKVVTSDAPKHIVNRSRNKIEYSDGTFDTAGTIYQKNKLSAGNKVPPSMRTGAPHAEGYQKYGIIGTDRTGGGRPTIKRGWTGTPSLRAKGGRIGAKKGGRVTGAAKRGFGRALMKGKK